MLLLETSLQALLLLHLIKQKKENKQNLKDALKNQRSIFAKMAVHNYTLVCKISTALGLKVFLFPKCSMITQPVKFLFSSVAKIFTLCSISLYLA